MTTIVEYEGITIVVKPCEIEGAYIARAGDRSYLARSRYNENDAVALAKNRIQSALGLEARGQESVYLPEWREASRRYGKGSEK